MKQIFYTEEGTPYVLRTMTTVFPIVSVAGLTLSRSVFVNWPANDPIFASFPTSIQLQTNKKIVPLSYTMSVQDAFTHDIIVDVSECYYSAGSGPNVTALPGYRSTLAKMIPYINRIYFTDEKNHSFTMQYNQLTFTANDFIDPSDKLLVKFSMAITDAMLDQVSPTNIAQIPAGSYNFAVTFTWYELLVK